MKKLLGLLLLAGVVHVEAKQHFTVTTTKDTGRGSFRSAIEKANACQKRSVIIFDLSKKDCGYNSKSDTWVFEPRSELPTIETCVCINGYSQCGSIPNTASIEEPNNAVLKLELRGAHLNNRADGLGHRGLTFGSRAYKSSVKGFSITSFPIGIAIYASKVSIQGSYVGIAPDGISARPNQRGIVISKRAEHTQIGTGASAGIVLIVAGGEGEKPSASLVDRGSCTRVQGVTLGLLRSGNEVAGGADYGLLSRKACRTLVGGKELNERVVSAGHSTANFFFTSTMPCHLTNVFGGTNTSGTQALGGGAGVVVVNSYGTTRHEDKNCPGISIRGSLFSGNDGSGIIIGQESDAEYTSGITIDHTYSGTDSSGKLPLPNCGHGIAIDFGKNTIVTHSLFNYNKHHGICALGSVCSQFDYCEASFNKVDGINFIPAACIDPATGKLSAFMKLTILIDKTTNICTPSCNSYTCSCYKVDSKGNKICC